MASSFNDDQLRQLALRLKNPYDQPDLVFEIPPGTDLLDIVNVYSFERYPTEKAFCVACGGRHHKYGFTALLTSGHRTLWGSTCGARRFGQNWTDAEKRLKELGSRQFELRRLDRFHQVAPSLERQLLRWEPAMAQVAGRRAAFEKHLGELASRIREAVLHKGGLLTVHRKIDTRAIRAALGTSRNVEEYQEVTVGKLLGREFLNPLDPAKAISEAVECLQAMKGQGRGEAIPTSRLAASRRSFERSLQRVEEAALIHAAAQEFLTVANFREILKWANEHGATKARYVIEADGIVHDEEKAGGIQIAAPPSIDAALLDLISDYRRAD